jgi:hypothetical protein
MVVGLGAAVLGDALVGVRQFTLSRSPDSQSESETKSNLKSIFDDGFRNSAPYSGYQGFIDRTDTGVSSEG